MINVIERESNSMADFQQHRPFKRQRIDRDEASLKAVENVPLPPSIIELDRISASDTLSMSAFEKPVEHVVMDSPEPDSLILLVDKSGCEIEKQEEHTQVRCLE
jgi:hypothetical protein